MKRSAGSHRSDASALVAGIYGSGADTTTLIDRGTYQIFRFNSTANYYNIPEMDSHILSIQHAPNPKVNYRVGDDNFSGFWESGACSIWPANAPRVVTLHQAIDATAIWLSPAFCTQILETYRFELRPTFNHRDTILSQTLDLLASSAEALGSYAHLHQDALATSLVAHLGGRHGVVTTAAQRGGLPPTRLRRVLEFIEDELHSEIELSTLCALAQVSQSHFSAMFRRSMGISPHAYVIKQRIERAKRMLRRDMSKNITEIAFCVGFRSSSHFSTIFSNKIGVTPRTYRKGR